MKRSLNTQSLVISRCCCAEEGKKINKEYLQRTCAFSSARAIYV